MQACFSLIKIGGVAEKHPPYECGDAQSQMPGGQNGTGCYCAPSFGLVLEPCCVAWSTACTHLPVPCCPPPIHPLSPREEKGRQPRHNITNCPLKLAHAPPQPKALIRPLKIKKRLFYGVQFDASGLGPVLESLVNLSLVSAHPPQSSHPPSPSTLCHYPLLPLPTSWIA